MAPKKSTGKKSSGKTPKSTESKQTPTFKRITYYNRDGQKYARIRQTPNTYFDLPHYEGLKIKSDKHSVTITDMISGAKKIYRSSDAPPPKKKGGLYVIECGGRQYAKGGVYDWEQVQKQLALIKYVADRTTLFVVEIDEADADMYEDEGGED